MAFSFKRMVPKQLGGSATSTSTRRSSTRTSAATSYGGGSYGGGSYGGGAPMGNPAQTALASDPAWLAYMRTVGAETAEAERITRAGIERVGRRLNLGREELADQEKQGQRSIEGNYESRGLLRSGEHEERQAEHKRRVGQQRSGLEMAAADEISGLSEALAARKLEQERRRAELGLTTGMNLAANA